VSIERKSLDDLVGCFMGDNRAKFERELQKGKHVDCVSVVIEGPFSERVNSYFRSQLNPTAAVQSVLTFQVRYVLAKLFSAYVS
jgi:DNA excision repair protein ERCC-4